MLQMMGFIMVHSTEYPLCDPAPMGYGRQVRCARKHKEGDHNEVREAGVRTEKALFQPGSEVILSTVLKI